VLFTVHAVRRYAERFPHSPGSIRESFERSIKFGVWTPSSEYYLDDETGAVFVVDTSKKEKTVITVLTKDLYYANTQMLGFYIDHAAAANPTKPQPVELGAREQQVLAKQTKESMIVDQAHEFAEELKYEHIPYSQELISKIREKYGLSRNNVDKIFIPAFYDEIRRYQKTLSIINRNS
jgi:hypothetical protein